jgi:hypothetical protein
MHVVRRRTNTDKQAVRMGGIMDRQAVKRASNIEGRQSKVAAIRTGRQ